MQSAMGTAESIKTQQQYSIGGHILLYIFNTVVRFWALSLCYYLSKK